MTTEVFNQDLPLCSSRLLCINTQLLSWIRHLTVAASVRGGLGKGDWWPWRMHKKECIQSHDVKCFETKTFKSHCPQPASFVYLFPNIKLNVDVEITRILQFILDLISPRFMILFNSHLINKHSNISCDMWTDSSAIIKWHKHCLV